MGLEQMTDTDLQALIAKATEYLNQAEGEEPNMPAGVERKGEGGPTAVDPSQAVERDNYPSLGTPAIHTNTRKIEDFSLAKAIFGRATGNWKGAELERDWVRSHPAMMGRETLEKQEILNVTDDVAGGFLVPEVTQAGIMPMLKSSSVVRSAGATVIENAPQSFLYNVQTGHTTTYWVGMEPLADAVTRSDVAFGQLRFELKRCAARVLIDIDLLRRAQAVESLVRRDIAEELGLMQDRAFLQGLGGNQPLGLMTWPQLNTTDCGGAYALEHLFTMMDEITNRNGSYSSWVMHPQIWSNTRQFQDGIARYHLMEDIRQAPGRVVLGMNVSTSTQLPTTEFFLGNWSDFLIAEGGPIEIHVLRERYLDHLQIGVLAVHRVDSGPRRIENFEMADNLS